MLIFLFADTRPSHASVCHTISFIMKQKFEESKRLTSFGFMMPNYECS